MVNRDLFGILKTAGESLARKRKEEGRVQKRLNSTLAKKIKSRCEELRAIYESLSQDISQILEISEFGDKQKDYYKILFESAKKEPDWQESANQLYELASRIKEDIFYYLGNDDAKSQENSDLEERMRKAITIGRRYFGT